MYQFKTLEGGGRGETFPDFIHSHAEVREKPFREDEKENRRSGVPGIILAAPADNRAGFLRHNLLQENGQVYPADAEESEHTVAVILHSAQHREMQGGIKRKIWRIRGKTGRKYVKNDNKYRFKL